MTNIIVLCVFATAAIAIVAVLLLRYLKKQAYLRTVLKKHPKIICALLNLSNTPSLASLSGEQKEVIRSFPIKDWDLWERLKIHANKTAKAYPNSFADFIDENMKRVRDRKAYTNVKLFSRQELKNERVIDGLTLEELHLIEAESASAWQRRDEIRKAAFSIRSTCPAGVETYGIIHKNKRPSNEEIVRNRKNIEELQRTFELSKGFDGWEKKQDSFCNQYWNFIKEIRPNDGRYTYQVEFQKSDRFGQLHKSKYKIWQGFAESFSTHLQERQTDKYKENLKKVKQFAIKNRYFYDHVYENLVFIAQKVEDEYGNTLVILVNQCKLHWSKDIYAYHYEHLIKKLNENEFEWLFFSNLGDNTDNGDYKAVVVIDFITSNDELKANAQLIMEHFPVSPPMIGYYSLVKEYDEDELLKIEDYLKPEEPEEDLEDEFFWEEIDEDELHKDDDIRLIREQFKRVNKHPFFSYVAITNTLIGEAGNAEKTKAVWLEFPNTYDFKLTDTKHGKIVGEYSFDGGKSHFTLSIDRTDSEFDDVVNYTYELFHRMGVLSAFRKKGGDAISFMNKIGSLAHH